METPTFYYAALLVAFYIAAIVQYRRARKSVAVGTEVSSIARLSCLMVVFGIIPIWLTFRFRGTNSMFMVWAAFGLFMIMERGRMKGMPAGGDARKLSRLFLLLLLFSVLLPVLLFVAYVLLYIFFKVKGVFFNNSIFTYAVLYYPMLALIAALYALCAGRGGVSRRVILRVLVWPLAFGLLYPAYLYGKVESLTHRHGREFHNVEPIRSEIQEGQIRLLKVFDISNDAARLLTIEFYPSGPEPVDSRADGSDSNKSEKICKGRYVYFRKNKKGTWEREYSDLLWGGNIAERYSWPPYNVAYRELKKLRKEIETFIERGR